MYVYGSLLGLVPVLFAVLRHWKRSHVKVNCWFCGLNNFISIKCQDGWLCNHCEQYNGFKLDGGYNRDIPAQWDSSLNKKPSFCTKSQTNYITSVNGLCNDCNKNQEMKISQLSSFEPIKPENFDQEIENFSHHLERAYKLCLPCELVVEEKLSRTKARILDVNLQVSGKKHQKSHYLFSWSFLRNVVHKSSFVTGVVAILITLSTHTTLQPDNIFYNIFSHGKEITPSVSHPIPSMSYFLPGSAMCSKLDFIQSPPLVRPFSRILAGNMETHLDYVGLYCIPLCISGLVLQAVASWHSSHKSGFWFWVAFSGTVLYQHVQVQTGNYTHIAQILQIMFTFLVVAVSWRVTGPKKTVLKKRNVSRNSSKPSKSQNGFSLPATAVIPKSQALEPIQNHSYATVRKDPCLEKSTQEGHCLTAANYLTLPLRSASSSLSQRTLSSLSVVDNTTLSSTLDIMSSASQEDARSDASVDSAFSNSDSLNLDAADSVNSSYQCLRGRKGGFQDGDVHSLIETLSIGSQKSRRKSCEFKTRLYGKDQKSGSVLSPPKLTNIMNESMRSGIWRNTRSRMQENQVPVVAESAFQTLSRPSSPNGSVHSQCTVRTQESARSFSPPNSFQPALSPVPSAWNAPASPATPHNMLSVCVPPNRLAANPSFGNFGSALSSSSMHQVFYTPYGLFHQMGGPFGNPAMYMMPPHSPSFNSRSPASSYGSQFSPQSCSSIPSRDNSFQYDSERDIDFSPKSSKGRKRTGPALSSSFLESVWQSRLAIMYTTLCYLILGLVVCAFSFSNVMTKLFSEIMIWK